MKYCLSVISFFLGLVFCINSTPDFYNTIHKSEIDFDNVRQLQVGESADIKITSELKEKYLITGLLKGWCFLPEFNSFDELSAEPIDYWFLLLSNGNKTVNQDGFIEYSSSWPVNDDGMPIISVEEFDKFVNSCFGDITLNHEVGECNNYYFDGQNYSACSEGEPGFTCYELIGLSVTNDDGKLIFTATMNEFIFRYEYFFFYDDTLNITDNISSYADKVNFVSAIPYADNERAVFSAYGKQLMLGEITMAEAIMKMIMYENTQELVPSNTLEMSYYINEYTREPLYLSVKKLH